MDFIFSPHYILGKQRLQVRAETVSIPEDLVFVCIDFPFYIVPVFEIQGHSMYHD